MCEIAGNVFKIYFLLSLEKIYQPRTHIKVTAPCTEVHLHSEMNKGTTLFFKYKNFTELKGSSLHIRIQLQYSLKS